MTFYVCDICGHDCKVEMKDTHKGASPDFCIQDGSMDCNWIAQAEGYPWIEQRSPWKGSRVVDTNGETKVALAPKNFKEEDKPQVSLLPMDLLVPMLEPAYRHGIDKYERESWRKGFIMSKMMDAALRHLFAFYYDGEDFDPDPGAMKYQKTHLGAVVFCIINMYNTWYNGVGVDDRP